MQPKRIIFRLLGTPNDIQVRCGVAGSPSLTGYWGRHCTTYTTPKEKWKISVITWLHSCLAIAVARRWERQSCGLHSIASGAFAPLKSNNSFIQVVHCSIYWVLPVTEVQYRHTKECINKWLKFYRAKATNKRMLFCSKHMICHDAGGWYLAVT